MIWQRRQTSDLMYLKGQRTTCLLENHSLSDTVPIWCERVVLYSQLSSYGRLRALSVTQYLPPKRVVCLLACDAHLTVSTSGSVSSLTIGGSSGRIICVFVVLRTAPYVTWFLSYGVAETIIWDNNSWFRRSSAWRGPLCLFQHSTRYRRCVRKVSSGIKKARNTN